MKEGIQKYCFLLPAFYFSNKELNITFERLHAEISSQVDVGKAVLLNLENCEKELA